MITLTIAIALGVGLGDQLARWLEMLLWPLRMRREAANVERYDRLHGGGSIFGGPDA